MQSISEARQNLLIHSLNSGLIIEPDSRQVLEQEYSTLRCDASTNAVFAHASKPRVT